jgi:hypothetical protein
MHMAHLCLMMRQVTIRKVPYRVPLLDSEVLQAAREILKTFAEYPAARCVRCLCGRANDRPEEGLCAIRLSRIGPMAAAQMRSPQSARGEARLHPPGKAD